MINRLNVPYTYPPLSFLKLQDYITNLVNQYGGVYWPLDDAANNPFNRVINTAVATGRELVLNGTFVDTSAWSLTAPYTITGGVLHVGSVGGGSATQSILQIGRVYQITYTILNYVSGTFNVRAGSTTTGVNRLANGTYTETLICSGNTALALLSSSSNFVGDIDNVSCKELNISASTATPTQLLNTDVWNGLGVGAWTAVASATISAQTTTRHDGASGTIIRIARNGVSTPCASQTILDTTKVQRVYGWCRSDGTAVPIVRHGTTTIFTGTASTDWQPYDLIFIPTATDLRLGSTTNTGTQFVEFDVTVVTLDTGIRQDECSQNGTFSADASWTKSTNATISGGVGVFTAVASGAGFSQNCLCTGKRYKIAFTVTAFTSGGVRSQTGNNGVTATAIGTYSDVLIATSSTYSLFAVGTSTLSIDNVTVTELSPLVALPVNGVVLGNTESNRLLTSASFDGVNDLINPYSAQLNSIQNLSTFSLGAFAIVSGSGVWTDGTKRIIVRKAIDANNVVEIYRGTGNNTIVFNLVLGGITKTVTVAAQSSVGWQHYMMTIDTGADQMKVYINGIQVGSTQTGLGVAVGNLSSTLVVIGANTTAAANPWSGRITQVTDLPATLAIDYISEISKLGDTF